MLTWPHGHGDWAATLAAVEPVFHRLAVEIGRREMLLINCPSADKAAQIRDSITAAGIASERLFLAVVASNDTWARDHGPLTVLENEAARLLDFRFNGWGGKFASDLDDAISGELAALGVFGRSTLRRAELVLEGGSIDSDGAGSLLTTTSCLLHPQRNARLSRQQIERQLRQLLGSERILWLHNGALQGDDTDGHIDMLARFCSTDCIAYQSCNEPGYAEYAALKAMQHELQALRTADGLPYRLLELPWPQPKFSADGRRLPASYANFLVINAAVLAPGYQDAADEVAAERLQQAFPGREVVQIDCSNLIQQGGSLHCLTMQFPQAVEFHSPPAG
jgi:agmatine/peptidylarginine deiminase